MSEAIISIRDLRKELGLTQAELAERVGIASIGHMSDIERGVPCSVKVALAIEALSGGRIKAATLSSDVALVEAARAVDHDDPDTTGVLAVSAGNDGGNSRQAVANA